jgi:HEPN domain-containing protein
MKRKDFQQLAAVRLREATILFQNRCWDGAYYLAGYAAECALKSCISKLTERHAFPDKKRVNASYTHDLEELLVLADLRTTLTEAIKGVPEFGTNWRIVRSWRESSRYQRPSHEDAAELLSALNDRKGGIFRWLKLHW